MPSGGLLISSGNVGVLPLVAEAAILNINRPMGDATAVFLATVESRPLTSWSRGFGATISAYSALIIDAR